MPRSCCRFGFPFGSAWGRWDVGKTGVGLWEEEGGLLLIGELYKIEDDVKMSSNVGSHRGHDLLRERACVRRPQEIAHMMRKKLLNCFLHCKDQLVKTLAKPRQCSPTGYWARVLYE